MAKPKALEERRFAMTTPAQPASKTVTVNGLAAALPRMGQSHGPADRVRARLHVERPGVQRPRPAPPGPLHIFALDVRGHGESAWSSTGAYGYAEQASDLAGIAQRLRLDKFVLIGTSMGGIIAMAHAAAHAERLSGLVINDIGPEPEAGTQRITQMVGARPNEFATLEDAMEYRRAISPITAGCNAEDQRELALGVLRQRPDGRWEWKMDPAYIRQRVEHGPPARPPLWPALKSLPCPTLVVWGTESDVLSEAQARRMVETLPRGQLVNEPGIGHAPTLVEPVVLGALDRFLGAL
jgi:pimeloyl-ACP methyl ester carboxylesterase